MISMNHQEKTPAVDTSVGITRRDITPPEGIRARNWGPATWDASVGHHHSMTLTALAIGDPGDSARLIIGLDATWWRREEDERRFRTKLLGATGVSPENLIVALSHTHAGPVLSAGEADLEGGHLIPGYLDFLAESAISAAKEAMEGVQPARIEWVRGKCDLASYRELVVDGRSVVGFVPDGPADDTLMVARLSRPDGSLVGTIVNYACHPTTLSWQNQTISPDYVGAMRALVEAETGTPCLFFQGASGELAPREQYTGDLSVADRHGTTLGHAVLSALSLLPKPGHALELTDIVESGASLAMWTPAKVSADATIMTMHDTVTLDLRAPSLEELEHLWGDINPRSLEERRNRARALRESLAGRETTDYPLWVWRLGDGIVVGTPGEPYSALQQNLRNRFSNHPIMVANFVNGPGFMYVPTEDAYERGAYQSWQTLFAPGSLERIENKAVEMIRSML